MNIQDTMDAVRDAMLMRVGVIRSRAGTHPHAAEMSLNGLNGDGKILPPLAEMIGASHARQSLNRGQAFAAGLGRDDFKQLLADVFKNVTVHRLKAHTAHRAVCAMRGTRDFKASEFPSVDSDIVLEEDPELGEYGSEVAIAQVDGLSARVKTYGKNIYMSREVIKNDDIELIAGLFSNAGAAAGRLEAGLVYGLLESNPTLSDSELMFHVSHENIEASVLGETSLGAAMGRLRSMLTPAGAKADLSAANLIVAPELELLANKLCVSAGLETSIKVIASPWLSAGRWYLQAAPDQSPVIALLHLNGGQTGIIVAPVKDKKMRDGLLFGVRFDVGIVPVGRVGIVRGGV